MCGFLGEVSNELLEHEVFKTLLDLSIHRGPDQQGFWSSAHCQLGFNRLAILDVTEAGKQPMISPSGRFVLVFNGEIYNYKSLQSAYRILDVNLRSTSDAEVLCHLLDILPFKQLLKELNGMFAIAVWDMHEQQLMLARDFAGIKPLFYGINQGTLVFASQFNQVFKHPFFEKKTLKPEAMKSFFGLGYMHAPDTVFEDIYQVEAGEMLVWDLRSRTNIVKKYYYNWEVSTELVDTAKQTKDIFKNTLEGVLARQLQSDVPIGTFLSSGFDSSLITAYAKHNKPDIQAFTFGIASEGKYDERRDAANYANHLHVTHQTDTAKESDLLDIIDAHFAAMPEPLGDYSSIPTYVISERARHFAKVMLSGDGGDELFWGYPRFRTSLHNAMWFKLPLMFRKLIIPVVRKSKKKVPWGVQMFNKFSDWILYKQIHFSDLDTFMSTVSLPQSVYKTYFYEGSLNKNEILQYLKENEFYGHLQRVLKKVDLMSMAHGLEVRVPFLDKEMIAFSNKVESGFTISHDEAKLLLKSSLYDVIPKAIVNTEKKGFSVPMAKWLRNDLKKDLIHTVLEQPFYGAEHVDMTFLKVMIEKFFKGDSKVDVWGIWHIYAWQKWAITHKLI